MKPVVVFLVACVLAFGVTIPKLDKMCRIRGWIPGAVTVRETISQKWIEVDRDGRAFNHISWTDLDIRMPGSHRINVTRDHWDRLKIGDAIEVIHVGDDTFLRDGIFASNGSFVIDAILLAAELAVAVAMVVKLTRTRAAADDRFETRS